MSTPFYKLRKDALVDASVTSRQCQHWKESGIFKPELENGQQVRNGRYTKNDIERLVYLRKLLDTETGLGLPVRIAKVLLGGPDFEMHPHLTIDVEALQITEGGTRREREAQP